MQGWINVDKYADVRPDVLFDLESLPWPLDDEIADEILLSQVLEHLSGNSDAFLSIMQEIYRVAKPGARIDIRMAHARHHDFFNDPTRSRPLNAQMFKHFDLALNESWQSKASSETPFAKYLKIDFSVEKIESWLNTDWSDKLESGEVSEEDIEQAAKSLNNVIELTQVLLRANKPFAPGKSLLAHEVLVIQRLGGMGDVVMALSALAAIKQAVKIPILLLTASSYVALCRQAPFIDGVFSDIVELEKYCIEHDLLDMKFCDWNPAKFGTSRFHQVDAFLLDLGLTLPDHAKTLALQPLAGECSQAVRGFLQALEKSNGKRIVLHPGISDANRTWPTEFWQSLLEMLKSRGYMAIMIGRSDAADGRSIASLPNNEYLDMTDKLSLSETVELLRHCDVLVSADSGPIQLAGATDIGIVGMYSVVAGRNRLPFRRGDPMHHAIAIAPDCAFAPCYPKINDPALVQKFCSDTGTAIHDVPAIFATWCLNDQPFQCVRSARSLEQVLAGIETLLSASADANEIASTQ